MLPFHAIRTEAELRRATAGLLKRWGAALLRGRLRCHFPRRAGLMRGERGMHFHMKPELFLQVSGSTTFTFPEEKVRVGPGELCLVPAGLPHSELGRAQSGAGPFCNLVFAYHREEVVFHLALANREGLPYIVLPSGIGLAGKGERAQLEALLAPLAGWAEKGGPNWGAVRGSLLAHLSLLQEALERPPVPADRDAEPPKVAQARRVVMQSLSMADLSAGSVARTLHSSSDYLSRLFRTATGGTLSAYIDAQRMERARTLLETSALNVAEVGRACGYDDPGYFARRFRRSLGASPRAYRRTALRRHTA